MRYRHEVPVAADPTGNCYLAFGESSWDGTTPVVKLGWRDRNGNRSRPGGELTMNDLAQATTEAIRLGYLSPGQALQAVQDGMQ